MTLLQIAQAKLRKPTSVASVAINGGSRTVVISQACRLPMRNPMTSVPTMAVVNTGRPINASPPRMRSGANSNNNVAQIVPLKQMTEPDERSIPPAIITTAEPSAKMPNSDVCRMISRA